jgi:hypothetical protein
MSNAFTQAIRDGWKAGRAAFGVDFTVAGDSTTYKGCQLTTDDLQLLGLGGFTQDYSGGLEYLSNEVTIANGAKVTINGVTYRVEHAASSSDDPVRKLFLIGKEK